MSSVEIKFRQMALYDLQQNPQSPQMQQNAQQLPTDPQAQQPQTVSVCARENVGESVGMCTVHVYESERVCASVH